MLARFPEAERDETLWPAIKLAYIALLHEHRQPECAETFYNSVACQVLHRRYYHNDFIFWRPAVATEHLEGDSADLPLLLPARRRGLARHAARRSCATSGSQQSVARTCERDLRNVLRALRQHFPRPARAQPDLQIQVLGSLFFRNKAAYVVGRLINGTARTAVRGADPAERARRALPRHAAARARTSCWCCFRFARAYFFVDMEVPAALRLVPALADAEQAARRAVHGGRPAQAGQDAVLPRPALPPEALDRQLRRRARHQGHGDAGVHAAVVSLRVQGDPRPLRAAEGHRPRRRSSRSTCW